jgi:hypothetical protein
MSRIQQFHAEMHARDGVIKNEDDARCVAAAVGYRTLNHLHGTARPTLVRHRDGSRTYTAEGRTRARGG